MPEPSFARAMLICLLEIYQCPRYLKKINSLHAGNAILHVYVVCQLFLKSMLLQKSFKNTIRVSNSLDPDQARHSACVDYQQTALAD